MTRAVRRIAVLVLPLSTLCGQTRFSGPIDINQRVVLRGSAHPMARAEFDIGPLDPARKIGPVILGLKPSALQQAALERLLGEQQDRASANYHKWLSPEEYADRFGAGREDVAAVAAWIESHGLTVEHRARARNWIGFSGTVAQLQAALHVELHRYRINGEEHFANASEVSIPAALEPIVSAFLGLNDLETKPRTKPRFTNGDGTHSLAPADIDTIYNIAPLHASGITGTGQKITVVGGSAIKIDDIRMFQSKFKLPQNDPQTVLFGPDPGINVAQEEGDLDIEWIAAVAPNATIIYVYSQLFVGAYFYAVDQNLAPVLSISVANCEPVNVGLSGAYRAIAQQANVQGMTVVAGTPDSGAAGCDVWFQSPIAVNGLAVSLPASIPEVTAVGGTEFNESGGNYWGASNTADGGSALSYIPEMAWNDTAVLNTLAGSGGGRSILFPKPAWQSGPGVPNDGARDVPDVALAASYYHDGYWDCAGGICRNRNGGDSFATPIFAGMVVLLNQQLMSKGILGQPGLGNINPVLYRMAQNTTNVFHDITAGNNIVPCAQTPDCIGGQLGYSAGPGYDLVTGLGSVDAFNLISQWDAHGTTTITVSGYSTNLKLSDNTPMTVTVTGSEEAAPTGSVSIYLEGTHTADPTLTNPLLLGTVALRSGSTSFQLYGGQLNAGSNTIVLSYSGDLNYNGSTATVLIAGTVPTSNSAVAVSISPFPVAEQPPDPNGFTWYPFIQLREVAGMATTLTDFTVAGVSYASLIPTVFGSNSLPAHGSLQTSNFAYKGLTPGTTLVFGFSGRDASGYVWSQQVNVEFGPLQQFVVVSFHGLRNGASFQEAFAPGMVLSVFGSTLSEATAHLAGAVPLPLTLGGTTVTINGVAAPFYYSSAGQLNIQIPYETKPGPAVLAVTFKTSVNQQTDRYSFTVSPSAPGIFVGPGKATVPFASGHRGQTLTLFITGEGEVSPPIPTGASPAPGTPVGSLPKPKLPVSMTIGGVKADIVFIGIPVGLVGTTQINFTVPANAPLGVQPVVVTVGGVASPPANFTVNP